MVKYAAHDSFFLVLIAHKQIKGMTERDFSITDGGDELQLESTNTVSNQLVKENNEALDRELFKVWFINFQAKLGKSLNEQIEKFLNNDDQQALQNSLHKAFRVQCDFYDPESDEYLKCWYLFKNLYELRDTEARSMNSGVE